jgi:hypothetical protein
VSISVVAISTRFWSGVGPILRLSTVSLKTLSLTEITENRGKSKEDEDEEVNEELVL